MNAQPPNDINRLMGQFLDLQEQWEDDPEHFNWEPLRALAADSAHAYNEGLGPSFHILAIDGMQHGEFHSRFLSYAVDAGFDPFKLVPAPSGRGMIAVFGHEALADAAPGNPWSARMLGCVQELARNRFDTAFDEGRYGHGELEQIAALCGDTIPADVLEKLLSTH